MDPKTILLSLLVFLNSDMVVSVLSVRDSLRRPTPSTLHRVRHERVKQRTPVVSDAVPREVRSRVRLQRVTRSAAPAIALAVRRHGVNDSVREFALVLGR